MTGTGQRHAAYATIDKRFNFLSDRSLSSDEIVSKNALFGAGTFWRVSLFCVYSFYCINQPVDKPQLSYMVNKVHKIFNVKVLKKR